MQIVNWLAQYKPKQLTKQGLVRPVLEALCKLCAESDPEDHDDEDQLSASKFASQVSLCPHPPQFSQYMPLPCCYDAALMFVLRPFLFTGQWVHQVQLKSHSQPGVVEAGRPYTCANAYRQLCSLDCGAPTLHVAHISHAKFAVQDCLCHH